MIYLKIHHAQNGRIVAMCDEEYIGKVFRDGKRELNLKKYASFYEGDLVSEQKAVSMLKNVEIYSANVVGARSIEVLRTKIDVEDSEILTIKKVPFVHVYNMI